MSDSRPPRTLPAIATPSAARSRSACRWCSPTRFRVRWRSSSGASLAPTVRSSLSTSPDGSAHPSNGSTARSRRWPVTTGWCSASSGPTASSASGATSTCCASSGVGRCRCCAKRSNRSSRMRSHVSCRSGTRSRPNAEGWRRWSTRSGCSPARRSWRRPSSVTCCRHDCSGTGPRPLDELCTSGEVVWTGAGSIGARDGRVRLCFADQIGLLAPGWETGDEPDGELHVAIRQLLAERGASFWGALREAAPEASDTELLVALWDLVWAGEVTNDTLAPLRALLAGGGVGGVEAPGTSAGRSAPPGSADAARPTGRCRSMEPGPAARRTGADPDRVGARPGAPAARTSRGHHPGSGARRGCAGRLRIGVRRAQGARGARPDTARLLRRRARRGPVRAAGCCRATARRPATPSTSNSMPIVSGADRARGHRSGSAVRRGAVVARHGGPAGPQRERPRGAAPGDTAGLVRPSVPSPGDVRRGCGRRRRGPAHSPRSWRPGASGASRSARSTVVPSATRSRTRCGRPVSSTGTADS